MTKEEFLELMGKGSEDEDKELIAAIEKVMDEKEKESEEDPEEGWHSDDEDALEQSDKKFDFIDTFIDCLSDKNVEALSEILEHHGIDGQKWGVRNGPPYPLERKKTHLLNKSKAKILIDNLDELSLEEVERLVKRIKLEEELNKIAADDIKKGESYAMKILKKTGETVLSVAVPAVTTYAFKKIIENVGGEDMVGEMFPKKK